MRVWRSCGKRAPCHAVREPAREGEKVEACFCMRSNGYANLSGNGRSLSRQDVSPATLRPDGTGQMNVGPFTRRTVGELLMGWTDPIFAPDGLVAGVAPTGLWMGLNQFASIEDQEAMLAAGAVPAEYFDMSVTTGKDDINDIHKWVRLHGATNYTAGEMRYPGWGLDGAPGTPLVVAGTRVGMGEPPLEQWPNIFASGGVHVHTTTDTHFPPLR